jgi:tetratricopeptide (TPR) repeat protein
VGLLALGALLGVRSARNAAAWQDDLALWTAVRDDRPSHPTAYYGIAHERLAQHDLGPAERGYRTYLEANPLDGRAAFQLGEVLDRRAASLPEAGSAEGGLHRSTVRVAQIEVYRHAWDLWERVGLVAGRGSEAMRSELLVKWINAAFDLGDLAEARRVQDRMLRLQGFDPRDARRVMETASWPQRRMRLVLAWEAWRWTLKRDLGPEQRRAADAFARDALRDAGLDPAAGEVRLRRDFAARLEALVAEAEQRGVTAEEEVWAAWALAVAEDRRLEEARRILLRARRAHPASRLLAQAHAAIEAATGDGR